MKHDSTSTSSDLFAYIHGRIDKEIEFFSISSGIPASIIQQKLASILYPLGQKGPQSNMSDMSQSSIEGDTEPRSLEGSKRAHRNGSQREGSTDTSSAASESTPHKVSKIKQYWDKFTPLQRKRIMAKRLAKRNDTMAKRMTKRSVKA